jgi:hypothetical protein
MKNFMLLTLAIILMFACQPDETVIPEGEVTIHLLTSFETTGNSCRIDGASAQWDSNALLNYEDLENYDVENYAFWRMKHPFTLDISGQPIRQCPATGLPPTLLWLK